MVSLKPVIFGVRGNECVARLVRGRSVKPFNHQESSNLSTLTIIKTVLVTNTEKTGSNKMDKPIEIKGDCKFMQDLEANNKFAIYNLIVSIRDVKLWTKGMKINRHWKISHVKKYFGMNGTPKVLLEKMETLYNVINGEE